MITSRHTLCGGVYPIEMYTVPLLSGGERCQWRDKPHILHPLKTDALCLLDTSFTLASISICHMLVIPSCHCRRRHWDSTPLHSHLPPISGVCELDAVHSVFWTKLVTLGLLLLVDTQQTSSDGREKPHLHSTLLHNKGFSCHYSHLHPLISSHPHPHQALPHSSRCSGPRTPSLSRLGDASSVPLYPTPSSADTPHWTSCSACAVILARVNLASTKLTWILGSTCAVPGAVSSVDT